MFFFFQAEDGIRDLTVTGVQTCALPISRILLNSSSRSWAHRKFLLAYRERQMMKAAAPTASRRARSEERRVGKECRSRWGPQTDKVKAEMRRATVVERG